MTITIFSINKYNIFTGQRLKKKHETRNERKISETCAKRNNSEHPPNDSQKEFHNENLNIWAMIS